MPFIATLVATDRTDFDISWSLNFICLSKPSFLQTRHESWFQVFSSKNYNLAYNYFQQNCSLFFKLVSELNVTFFNLKIPKQVKSLPTFEITSQKSYMICPKNCRKFTSQKPYMICLKNWTQSHVVTKWFTKSPLPT